MPPSPQQSPLPALAITCGILGILSAMGLLCAEWQAEYSGSAMQAFFTNPPQQETCRALCFSIPQAAPPEMQLASAPSQLPPADLPDEIEVLELPDAEQQLPLLADCEMGHPPPQEATKPSSSQATTPVAQSALVPPTPLATPPPAYPPTLRATRRSGSVRVRIHIDTAGSPRDVDVLSSTHPAFAAAARECILAHWRFSPAQRGKTPVPATAVQTIHFRPIKGNL